MTASYNVDESQIEAWAEAIRRDRRMTSGVYTIAHGWGHAYAVSYGRPGWCSQSYRLFVWEMDQ